MKIGYWGCDRNKLDQMLSEHFDSVYILPGFFISGMYFFFFNGNRIKQMLGLTGQAIIKMLLTGKS